MNRFGADDTVSRSSVRDDAALGAVAQYQYATYMDKARWTSIWHQIDSVRRSGAHSVLEVGKGVGVLGAVLKQLGLRYVSVDVDAGLRPDCVASVSRLPFADGSFDAVCCFQVLEHLPFGAFEGALAELRRVTRCDVIISLPDSSRAWEFDFRFSSFVVRRLHFPLPFVWPARHFFDGEHFWEIGKRGYPLGRVIAALESGGLGVVQTFRVPGNPYHRFFLTRVRGGARSAGEVSPQHAPASEQHR